MLEKNKEYVVDIIDNGYEGEGIAKIDNFTVFIPNCIKGEKVRILIVKILKTHSYGKVLEILTKSEYREESDCNIYKQCGGCNLRHVDYEYTLNMKKEIVENCISKELGKKVKIENTVGMGIPYFYRNKLQYPLGIDRDGKPKMGIYTKRTHDIISTNQCYIQNELSQEIANDIYAYIIENKIEVYNEATLKGLVRHIVIKIGVLTNEVMVILVLNNSKLPKEKEFVKYLTEKYPEVKTVVKNMNSKNTNVILGPKDEVIYGDGYIYDNLGEYKFKISPKSFYQTNPVQTEVLYNIAVEYANLTGKENIFDLYCGIGTIGIFASKKAKEVYGIEIVEEAIIDAKENSKINNIKNINFFAGPVEKIFPDIIEKENIEIDVVFLDPPRKGIDTETLETILKIGPKKVVYISCNPATLARDLKTLAQNYKIQKVQPVDMFPYTSHIETVSLLTLQTG